MPWIQALGFFAVLLAGEPQLPPAARANLCATCHLQIVQTRSTLTHTDEWVTSSHALHGVGCEKCHGGDATTSDRTAAHRGVTRASDPSSPVSRGQLPATCGGCHAAETNAFERSTHNELLQTGDAWAPTCTTCHSSMAADVLSPTDLERSCAHCHVSDRVDRAQRARRQMVAIADVRRVLWRVRFEIAGVQDGVRRDALTGQARDADIAVQGVVAAMHAFDQPLVDRRLDDARLLMNTLENALRR